ncbi:MAG: type II toxin-antitoxin system HicA family toxin [Vicinamibacterales bacterium]
MWAQNYPPSLIGIEPVCSEHPISALTKPSGRFTIIEVTWAEVIRKLKAAGFVEIRSGKGSHLLLKHPTSGKEVWVAVHTKKDAGRLGNRILRDAGVE